ncbi:hypothetical protein Plhal703r1_c50g0154271 [Plasmopara halstedii]
MSSLHVCSPLWKNSPQLCDACWSHSDSDDNTIASASLGLDSTIANWEVNHECVLLIKLRVRSTLRKNPERNPVVSHTRKCTWSQFTI